MEITCDNCNKLFTTKPAIIKYYKTHFCSLKCRGLFNRSRLDVICDNCGKQFETYNCYTNRNKRKFCSTTCYHASDIDRIKRLTCTRSKAEDFIFENIQKDFPNLKITLNDRTILSNGLEIDICINELKIAIEINGPSHYKNIYGDKALIKTIIRDNRKLQELNAKSFTLKVIDISKFKNFNQSKKHLTSSYEEVKSLIITKLQSYRSL